MSSPAKMLRPNQKLAIPAHVYARPFGEQVVLLDFGRGDYYGLDAVGAVLWATAAEGGSVSDAATRVLASFEGAGHDQIMTDLLAVAKDLVEHGLLGVVGP